MLRHGVEIGESASVIAAKITYAFGVKVSRNAVISKSHRMGFDRGPEFSAANAAAQAANMAHRAQLAREAAARRAERERQRKAAAEAAKAAKVVAFNPSTIKPPTPLRTEPMVYDATNSVALMDLQNHHCRWPYGQGEAIRFCGARKDEGSSYCQTHRLKATNETQPKGKVRAPRDMDTIARRVG